MIINNDLLETTNANDVVIIVQIRYMIFSYYCSSGSVDDCDIIKMISREMEHRSGPCRLVHGGRTRGTCKRLERDKGGVRGRRGARGMREVRDREGERGRTGGRTMERDISVAIRMSWAEPMGQLGR